MTAKRFRLGYVCGDYGLIDNDKWIDLHSMSENSEKNVQICINKMNELADENEQLKSDVYDWKASAEDYLKLGKSLKRENEELKSDKEHLMGCLIRFFGYDDEDIDYNLNRESNREYGKQYYSMKEETKKEL